MIYIPIQRSLVFAHRVTKMNPTDKQRKSIRDSMTLVNHQKNLMYNSWVKPTLILIQPWESNLPLGIDIPVLPYV